MHPKPLFVVLLVSSSLTACATFKRCGLSLGQSLQGGNSPPCRTTDRSRSPSSFPPPSTAILPPMPRCLPRKPVKRRSIL